MTEHISVYRSVLEDLAHSRGFLDAEALAMRAVELDPSYTVRDLLERPPGGFGTALDAVLCLSEDEKARVSAAFAAEFMSPARLPKRVKDGTSRN
jgi:hypothetical protein